MNAKIIAVWGANGSGKTTFSTDLAQALAARSCMVGVISSKLYYGELQTRFGCRIESNQGIYKALGSGDTKNMFTQSAPRSTVFFMGPPNEIDAMLLTSISMESTKDMIEDAAIRFDYLIIDGSEELNNPISSVGLVMASQIFIMHKPSVRGCLWHQSTANMMDMLHLRNKATHILYAYDKTCDKAAFMNSIGVKFDYELPYIDRAKVLENSGKLIYLETGAETRKYRQTIDRIANFAEMV